MCVYIYIYIDTALHMMVQVLSHELHKQAHCYPAHPSRGYHVNSIIERKAAKHVITMTMYEGWPVEAARLHQIEKCERQSRTEDASQRRKDQRNYECDNGAWSNTAARPERYETKMW